MPGIRTCGIYLPNGIFLPNQGDGHAKNASRFCFYYKCLDDLLTESGKNADEFMISAGCGIVASYRCEWVFKVAKNNPYICIDNLIQMYVANEFKVQDYWILDPKACFTLRKILENKGKMRISVKEEAFLMKDLRNKRGFFWNGSFYPNDCSRDGHDGNAMEIIEKSKKLHPKEDWNWNSGSAPDFMVLKKRAIQIGSGNEPKCIIVAGKYYHEDFMKKFMENHNLAGYKVHYIW